MSTETRTAEFNRCSLNQLQHLPSPLPPPLLLPPTLRYTVTIVTPSHQARAPHDDHEDYNDGEGGDPGEQGGRGRVRLTWAARVAGQQARTVVGAFCVLARATGIWVEVAPIPQ